MARYLLPDLYFLDVISESSLLLPLFLLAFVAGVVSALKLPSAMLSASMMRSIGIEFLKSENKQDSQAVGCTGLSGTGPEIITSHGLRETG